tara:strand:+ start:444 stop:563 length:120 start_codon:yes stop_codon:yes gene_type:complete
MERKHVTRLDNSSIIALKKKLMPFSDVENKFHLLPWGVV